MCNAKSMWPEAVVLGPLLSSLKREDKPSSCSPPTPGSSGEQEALQKGPLEGWLVGGLLSAGF